jgi:hypothetical protein
VRTSEHAAALRALPADTWEAYLAEHSGLPGPRGNLELLAAVGDEAPAERLRGWAASDDEYLACCGTAGLGRLVGAPGDADDAALLRAARDERWRVREGVAMALQRVGDRDQPLLRALLGAWLADPTDGRDVLVLRAAAAGVCEPRLLRDPATAAAAFDVLDHATAALAALPAAERRRADVRTLRQGLGYCWSVAVAGDPTSFARFEHWADTEDVDVRWVVKENLGKSRLTRADADGVARVRRLL